MVFRCFFYCFCEKSFYYNVNVKKKITQKNRDKKIRRQKRVENAKRKESFVRLLNWNHMKNESTKSIQFIVFTHYCWMWLWAQESILCSSLRQCVCVCVFCGQRWRTHKTNAAVALFRSLCTLFSIRWEQIRDFSFISLFNNVAWIVAFSLHRMAGFIEKRDFMVHFTYYDPLVWSVFAIFAVFISFHFAIRTCLIVFLGRTFFFFVSFNCFVFGIVLLFYHFKCAPVLDSRSFRFVHKYVVVCAYGYECRCAIRTSTVH